MDIYLSGISGVDTILEVSSRNTLQLVFITASQEHAIEAFGLNAAHYLVKPITENDVEEALERCLSRMGMYGRKHIDIKTNNGNILVPTDQIVYIEVYNKTCIIHTKKSVFEKKSSLDAIYDLLNDDTFIRAQRSFVVNMHFIESFSFDRIALYGGTEIAPSRNNWNELKKTTSNCIIAYFESYVLTDFQDDSIPYSADYIYWLSTVATLPIFLLIVKKFYLPIRDALDRKEIGIAIFQMLYLFHAKALLEQEKIQA